MTAPDPKPIDPERIDPADELDTRLAAIELRIRLLETDDGHGAPAPRAAEGSVDLEGSPAETSPDAEESWYREALALLTMQVELLRAQTVRLAGQLNEQQKRVQSSEASLAALTVVHQEATASSIQAYAQAYGDGQVARAEADALRGSRSYRYGRRLARPLQGVSDGGPRLDEVLVQGVHPDDVAVIVTSGVFDPDWYEQANPDVAASGVDPLAHYLAQGTVEGRNPTATFDTRWYAGKYAAEIPDGVNPLAFYLRTGWLHGHWPSPGFDPEEFFDAHPDVRPLDVSPLVYLALTSRAKTDNGA